MLELRNVSFQVDSEGAEKEIVRDISLTVPDRKLIVVTGPNGGGKSTLARLIAGIEKPTGGKIFFGDTDITEKSVTERARMGIAYAFQQPVRFKGIRVVDLIRIAAGKTVTAAEACDYLSAFDEPEAGIDLWSFRNLIDVFRNMRETIEDSSILVISHQERILNIADEIIVIKDGRVEKQGTREEIYPSLGADSAEPPACDRLMKNMREGEND